MVQVTEDHLLAVVMFQSTHGQGWTFQVATQVFDVAMVILAGLGEVNDPGFLVVAIEPTVESGFIGAGGLQGFR